MIDTYGEWVLTASSLEDRVAQWAGRPVKVFLGLDDGSMGAPARYLAPGRIEMNTDMGFPGLRGAQVGELSRVGLTRFPVAGGLLLHEAMHARLSTVANAAILTRVGSPSAYEVFMNLEEVRIEGRGVELFPGDLAYLRASTRKLVVPDETALDGVSPRAVAILMLGRVSAGVFQSDEVEPLRSWLLTQDGWSSEILQTVRDRCLEVVRLADTDDRMAEIAQELDALMPEEAEPEPDAGSGAGSSPELAEILEGILGKIARAGMAEAYERGDVEEAQEKARTTETFNAERAQSVSIAQSVFGQRMPMELAGSRPPLPAERGAAVVLAKELEDVRYRDREVLDAYSSRPPGRLVLGSAMRQSAARSLGLSGDTYEPFHIRRRIETDEPTLTVGILSDVSGSMSRAQGAVASANYVVSDALYRVGAGAGSAAQVYFASEVHPGLRRGERLTEVRTWTGGGSAHKFDKAMRALDGELNLIGGSGARLVFVVSDGQYETVETRAVRSWHNTCKQYGVAVVWLKMTGVAPSTFYPDMDMTVVDLYGQSDPLVIAKEIGLASVRALAQASGI